MRAPVARPLVASIAIALAGVASAHCGGNVPITGKACPCLDGFVCCAADTCIKPNEACPADGTKSGLGLTVTPETIIALCNAPHGPPLAAPRTAAGMTRLLARRWYVCGYDPKSWSPLLAKPGLEFRPNGDWAFVEFEADRRTLTVPAAPGGVYGVYNDLLETLVPTTDTTTGSTLHVRWFNDKLDPFHEGKLDLKTDFEHSPLRFRTEKGIPTWYVALDQTGIELDAVEGTACAPDNGCREGARCVYERNVTVCSKPATVQRGEGCDRQGTRTCAPNLTCLDNRRCGDPS